MTFGKVVVVVVAALSFLGCDLDPLEYCMKEQDEAPRRPRARIPERYTPRSELLADLERFRMNLEAAKRAEEVSKKLELSDIDTVDSLDSPATTREEVSPVDSPAVRARKFSDAIPMTRNKPVMEDRYDTPKLSGSFRPKKFDALEAMRLHRARHVEKDVETVQQDVENKSAEEAESDDGTDGGDDDNSLLFGEPDDADEYYRLLTTN